MDTPMTSGLSLHFQSVSTDIEGQAQAQYLDENDKRKHAVDFCHTNIVTPLLRKYIQPFVKNLYDDFVRCQQLTTQHPPTLSCKGFSLQYASINNNHRRMKGDWNYKVNSHVDFSKLFLDHWESEYTDFTECPASAVLRIIQHMNVFPKAVKTHIENYRNQVRNPLAHCDQAKWSNDKFGETLEMMKSLIRLLDLPENEIQQSIEKLDEWRQKKLIITIVRQQTVGLNFKQGETTGSDHLGATVHGLNEAQEKKTTDKLTQTEPTECEALEILSASKGSIKLDLRADLDIFRTPESFKTAVHELLERVIDASGIGPDEVACLDVDFILPKTLTEEQLRVVASAFPGSFAEKNTRNEGGNMSTKEQSSVPMNKKMSDDDQTRCIRVLLMMKQLYPKMMRKMAEQNALSPSDIHGLIYKDTYGFYSSLSTAEKKLVSTLKQTGYRELDQSFLYKIIKCFKLVTAPTNKWGNAPTAEEQVTPGDDVERMRKRRNCVIHLPSPYMSEHQWSEFFEELIGIAKRCDTMLYRGYRGRFEMEANTLKSEWLDLSKRDKHIQALEQILQLKEQHRAMIGDFQVSKFLYGADIEEKIRETYSMSKEDQNEHVFVDMFLRGVKDQYLSINRLTLVLDNLKMKRDQPKMNVINLESGCMPLHVLAYAENFTSKDVLHARLEDLIRRVHPFLKGSIEGELTVVVSIDTTKDDLVNDSRKWRKTRKHTLPELDYIERKLDEAGNDIRNLRRVRNVGVLLGLGLAFATMGASLGLTAGAMAAGFTLITHIMEKYLTGDTIRNTQILIDRDKNETENLRKRLSFYVDRDDDRYQEQYARRLEHDFPDAIIRTLDKQFIDFLTSFIDTEVGSVFRARDEVKTLKETLKRELEKVEKIEREASISIYY